MLVGDFEMFPLLGQGKGTCPEKCRDPRSGKRRTLLNNKNTMVSFGQFFAERCFLYVTAGGTSDIASDLRDTKCCGLRYLPSESD